MRLRTISTLFRDLIQVLPQRAREEWQDVAKIDPNRPTVILVSGFAATQRNLSVMRKRLLRDGFNVLVLPMDWHALSDSVRGLYRMSERLSQILVQLRKGSVRRDSPIYLVAHSAGGLVARYYVQQLGGFHYCDGLVTLGTPHQGTWIAAFGFICHLILKARCLFQMMPISPFIHRINEAPFPSTFRLLSVSSRNDLLSYPTSTILPEEISLLPQVKSVALHGLSHGDLLVSKIPYRLMLNFIRQELVPAEAEIASPTSVNVPVI